MMRFFLSLICLTLLTAISSAADPGWKAGFAKVPITPEEYIWMAGYGSRTAPADGKETELWAKAMVLQPATGNKIVLVTLDLVGIDHRISQLMAKHIAESQKTTRDSICLSVSHTHCGPVLGNTLRSMYFFDADMAVKVEKYTDKLPSLVLKAVETAAAAMEPVSVSSGVGMATFAVNRRTNKEPEVPQMRAAGKLNGPVDHDVPVLVARDSANKIKGIVFGYACHATTMGYQKWSGDYPGFAMINLEESHPGSVAMFFAGCGADQNPLPRRTVEMSKGYGKQLSTAVENAIAAPMHALSPEASTVYKEINVPLAEIPTREKWIQESMDKNKFIASRAKMLLARMAKGEELPTSYPYCVQTWRLGKDLTLVTLGGEVVVDYSLRLKKELGQGNTWVMGYANDIMAYIPSLRVLKEGGYEGGGAMVYYGMPSIWGNAIEEMIIAECHKQARAVGTKK